MAKAPTYADLDKEKANADMANQEAQQMGATRQDVEANANENAVLKDYISRQVASRQPGLGAINQPMDAGDFVRGQMAQEDAPRQQALAEELSVLSRMIDSGEVPFDSVMKNPNVDEVTKNELANMKIAKNASQGLGQIR